MSAGGGDLQVSEQDLRRRLQEALGLEDGDAVPPVTATTRRVMLAKLEAQGSPAGPSSAAGPSDPGPSRASAGPRSPRPAGTRGPVPADAAAGAAPPHTLVFFDLETTGLPSSTFRPRITELSMVAVGVGSFRATEPRIRRLMEALDLRPEEELERIALPRVLHKLTLCLNPESFVTPDVADLTGLDNESLEDLEGFSRGTARLVAEFLARLPGPVCLVAHNGLRFDFPLFQAELFRACRTSSGDGDPPQLTARVGGPVLCLDSLPTLKTIFRTRPAEGPRFNGRGRYSPPSTPPGVRSHSRRGNHRRPGQLPELKRRRLNLLALNGGHRRGIDLEEDDSSDDDVLLRAALQSDVNRDPVDIVDDFQDADDDDIFLQVEEYVTPEKSFDSGHDSSPPPPPTKDSGEGRARLQASGYYRMLTSSPDNVSRARKCLEFSVPSTAAAPRRPPTSFSLPVLHKHIFGALPRFSHGAEADCLALMRVCAYRGEEFLQYLNSNVRPLSSVQKMW